MNIPSPEKIRRIKNAISAKYAQLGPRPGTSFKDIILEVLGNHGEVDNEPLLMALSKEFGSRGGRKTARMRTLRKTAETITPSTPRVRETVRTKSLSRPTSFLFPEMEPRLHRHT